MVVKVETDQAGLYGPVAPRSPNALHWLQSSGRLPGPLLQGRDPANMKTCGTCCMSSYWRNGPVLNTHQWVDWRLGHQGKVANMPVYDLMGGKCREGAMVFAMLRARAKEVLDNCLKYQAEGRAGCESANGRLWRARESLNKRNATQWESAQPLIA